MTKKISPAIKALKKVLKFARNNKLRAANKSGCVYHNEKTDRYCAVGCLLPKEIIALIKKNNLNEACGAIDLYHAVPNLEKITGLCDTQANILQELHDGWANGEYRKQVFVDRLQQAIKTKQLNDVDF